jgi:hypothetical protein
MEKGDEFVIFAKINDELNKIIETWDAKKL